MKRWDASDRFRRLRRGEGFQTGRIFPSHSSSRRYARRSDGCGASTAPTSSSARTSTATNHTATAPFWGWKSPEKSWLPETSAIVRDRHLSPTEKMSLTKLRPRSGANRSCLRRSRRRRSVRDPSTQCLCPEPLSTQTPSFAAFFQVLSISCSGNVARPAGAAVLHLSSNQSPHAVLFELREMECVPKRLLTARPFCGGEPILLSDLNGHHADTARLRQVNKRTQEKPPASSRLSGA